MNIDKFEIITKELLYKINLDQIQHRSSGMRRSNQMVSDDQKLLDALARLFCLCTSSTCAAVYLDMDTKKVMLSVNGDQYNVSYMSTQWQQVINTSNKLHPFKTYLNYFIKNKVNVTTVTKVIHGYMSVKNCDKLMEILSSVIGLCEMERDSELNYRFIDNLTQFRSALTVFCNKYKSIQKIDDDLIKLYSNAITEAQNCTIFFKSWKQKYKSSAQQDQDRKPLKYFIQHLQQDPDCHYSQILITQIRQLKKLIYSFRKIDTDLDKLINNNEKLKPLTNILAPSHDINLHAEMKIVDCLVQNQYFNIPESTHRIGISKLACAMCNVVINSCNKFYKVNIIVRGYHGKVYPKWGIPITLIDNEELYKLSLTTLAADYQKGFLLQSPQQNEMASTNTSMSTYSSDLRSNSPSHIVLHHNNKKMIYTIGKIIKNLISLEQKHNIGNVIINLFNSTLFYKIDGEKYYPNRIAQIISNDYHDNELQELLKLLGESSAEESWD